MSREQRMKSQVKKMVMQPEFRARRERNKKEDYSRKGKNKFNTNGYYEN